MFCQSFNNHLSVCVFSIACLFFYHKGAGAKTEARGNYVLSVGLAQDALEGVEDDPDAPIVERENLQLENGVIYTGQMKVVL